MRKIVSLFLIILLLCNYSVCFSESNSTLIENTVKNFSTYFKNPSSVELFQYFDPTGEESVVVACLMDISAQNSFGGTTTDTYFMVISKESEKFSAIAFDGIVTHFDELRDKNTVFAMILTLEHEGGEFVANQLNLDRETAAVLLRIIYDYYYKTEGSSQK